MWAERMCEWMGGSSLGLGSSLSQCLQKQKKLNEKTKLKEAHISHFIPLAKVTTPDSTAREQSFSESHYFIFQLTSLPMKSCPGKLMKHSGGLT